MAAGSGQRRGPEKQGRHCTLTHWTVVCPQPEGDARWTLGDDHRNTRARRGRAPPLRAMERGRWGAGAQIQRLAVAEHHSDATGSNRASSHVGAARRAQVNMGQSIVSRSQTTAKEETNHQRHLTTLLLLSSGHQWSDHPQPPDCDGHDHPS